MMKFRSGAVSATVWENARKDGSSYNSVKLSRSYRDKQTQEWKETSSFSVNELPVVAILARKAFEVLALDHAPNGGGAHEVRPETMVEDLIPEEPEGVREKVRGRRRG